MKNKMQTETEVLAASKQSQNENDPSSKVPKGVDKSVSCKYRISNEKVDCEEASLEEQQNQSVCEGLQNVRDSSGQTVHLQSEKSASMNTGTTASYSVYKTANMQPTSSSNVNACNSVPFAIQKAADVSWQLPASYYSSAGTLIPNFVQAPSTDWKLQDPNLLPSRTSAPYLIHPTNNTWLAQDSYNGHIRTSASYPSHHVASTWQMQNPYYLQSKILAPHQVQQFSNMPYWQPQNFYPSMNECQSVLSINPINGIPLKNQGPQFASMVMPGVQSVIPVRVMPLQTQGLLNINEHNSLYQHHNWSSQFPAWQDNNYNQYWSAGQEFNNNFNHYQQKQQAQVDFNGCHNFFENRTTDQSYHKQQSQIQNKEIYELTLSRKNEVSNTLVKFVLKN